MDEKLTGKLDFRCSEEMQAAVEARAAELAKLPHAARRGPESLKGEVLRRYVREGLGWQDRTSCPDEPAHNLGRWMLSKSPEVVRILYAIGEALQEIPDQIPPAALDTSGKGPGKQKGAGNRRSPRRSGGALLDAGKG